MHVGGMAVEVPAGIKLAFVGRPNHTGNVRQRCTAMCCTHVCYVPAGDAAHAAVIAHCSITAACSLRAPASLKTHTSDVRRRHGCLRFGYRIRRRPATERCTAGCDRGFTAVANCQTSFQKARFSMANYIYYWRKWVWGWLNLVEDITNSHLKVNVIKLKK